MLCVVIHVIKKRWKTSMIISFCRGEKMGAVQERCCILCWNSRRASGWTRNTSNPGEMPWLHSCLSSFSVSFLGCVVNRSMVLVQVRPGTLLMNVLCGKASHEFAFALPLDFVWPTRGRCSVKQSQLAGFCGLSQDLGCVVDHGSIGQLKIPSWEIDFF